MIVLKRKRWKFKPSEAHTRYTNVNGNYVPSCTTILKILSKDALIKWANYLGWKKKRVQDELDKSSIIGTLTHGYIEDIIQGKKIDLSPVDLHGTEIYNGVVNSLNSFIKWWKNNKHRIKILHIELQMCGEYYGGTTDLVCELDGKLCILDFKTSKDFYYSMFLQTAAYARLYEETIDKTAEVQNLAILRLDKYNGKEAELMDVQDIILNQGLVEEYSNMQLIKFYADTYEKIVDLFYDLYDITNDWGKPIC